VFGKRPTSGNTAVAERPAPAPVPAPPPAAPPPAPAAAIAEGGRTPFPSAGLGAPIIATPSAKPAAGQKPPQIPSAVDSRRSDSYYEVKSTIFGALIEAIDLGQLAKLDADSAREEIRDIVNEIIAIKNIVMSISEQEDLLDDICNDVLGYGPLEPLLARDEIADIMVNGSGTVYIEVGGKIQKTGIRFRDNQRSWD
jgi:pilus assembly protein CpaF